MMGDAVNLAARLESAAKQYGVEVQLSEDTFSLVTEGKFLFRRLDTVRVVGRTTPITTYELLGFSEKVASTLGELVDHFHRGLEYYQKRNWDRGIEAFEKALKLEPHASSNPSMIYIQRCREFKSSPPPQDWEGVWTLDAK